MYAGRRNLEAGRYRADSALVLAVYHEGQLLGMGEYEPGDEFTVPHHVNGYVSAVVWGTGSDTEEELARLKPRWSKVDRPKVG